MFHYILTLPVQSAPSLFLMSSDAAMAFSSTSGSQLPTVSFTHSASSSLGALTARALSPTFFRSDVRAHFAVERFHCYLEGMALYFTAQVRSFWGLNTDRSDQDR